MTIQWWHILIVCVVSGGIYAMISAREIRINNFRQNCKVGDHCSYYYRGERMVGTILQVKGSTITIVTLDNVIRNQYRDQIFPA